MSRSVVRAPSRALLDAFQQDRNRSICTFAANHPVKRYRLSTQHRNSSTATAQGTGVEGNSHPRWAQTPRAMKAPVQPKPKDSAHQPFRVNQSPAKLDAVYDSLLGPGGHQLLSEETKWIAVTHKSFDQGRRGFNDRLAYLGKRIIELQLSLGILSTAQASNVEKSFTDPHGREPFQHPALVHLESLSTGRKSYLGRHSAFAKLGARHGLPTVVRWQPKDPQDLAQSGSDMVYAQVMFAIVGAIALEKGGAVANQVVREKILRSLKSSPEIEAQADLPQ